MKTLCKFVGEVDKEPKDVIMVSGKDVTLGEYFTSLGIVTPQVIPVVQAPAVPRLSAGGGGRVGGGEEKHPEGMVTSIPASTRTPPIIQGPAIGGGGLGRSRGGSRGGGAARYAPSRKFNVLPAVGKYSPNKFMGGVTKRSTHIKPYLEAYNRYTTAERRRLRGDPVMCVCRCNVWSVFARGTREISGIQACACRCEFARQEACWQGRT